MRIVSTSLPADTLVASALPVVDYLDAFRGELRADGATLDEAFKSFFRTAPGWLSAMLDFRNRITRRLGLKAPAGASAAERAAILRDLKVAPGESVGLFRIFARAEHEVLAGEDDKHLDFRVGMLLEPVPPGGGPRGLIVATAVRMHNPFGRFYFALVRPFHRFIVPVMLRAMIRDLERSGAAKPAAAAGG